MQQELLNLAVAWEQQAGRYFVLAESELDPLGKKFYHSSAVTLCNYAVDLKKLLAAEFWTNYQKSDLSAIRSIKF